MQIKLIVAHNNIIINKNYSDYADNIKFLHSRYFKMHLYKTTQYEINCDSSSEESENDHASDSEIPYGIIDGS